MEDTIDDSGHGLLSSDSQGDSELEASSVRKNLRLGVKVGSIVGLSCGGQEGIQMDCLKQIVVKKHGKGGGNLHVADQQEVESRVWERGNCSDYEA